MARNADRKAGSDRPRRLVRALRFRRKPDRHFRQVSTRPHPERRSGFRSRAGEPIRRLRRTDAVTLGQVGELQTAAAVHDCILASLRRQQTADAGLREDRVRPDRGAAGRSGSMSRSWWTFRSVPHGSLFDFRRNGPTSARVTYARARHAERMESPRRRVRWNRQGVGNRLYLNGSRVETDVAARHTLRRR